FVASQTTLLAAFRLDVDSCGLNPTDPQVHGLPDVEVTPIVVVPTLPPPSGGPEAPPPPPPQDREQRCGGNCGNGNGNGGGDGTGKEGKGNGPPDDHPGGPPDDHPGKGPRGND